MSLDDKAFKFIMLGNSAAMKFDPANGWNQWKNKISSIIKASGYGDALTQEIIHQSSSSRKSFGPSSFEAPNQAAQVTTTSTSSSSSSSSSSSTADMESKSLTVYTFLQCCLPSDQLKLVQHIPSGDAYGVWNALLTYYEGHSQMRTQSLRRQFHSFKMKPNESFDIYASRLSSLIVLLNDDGADIKPIEVKTVLIDGLPAEYDIIVDQINFIKDITFANACAFIKEKRERVMSRKAEADAAHSITEAAQGNKGGRGNYKHYNNNNNSNSNNNRNNNNNYVSKNCYVCKQSGHIGYFCPQAKDMVKCDNCRYVGGHTTAQCNKPSFVKKNNNPNNNNFNSNSNNNANSNSGNNNNNNNNKTATAASATTSSSSSTNAGQVAYAQQAAHAVFDPYNEDTFTDFLLSVTNSNSNASATGNVHFLLDSAASRHMVNDRSLLTDIKTSAKGVPLTVANNETIHLNEFGNMVLINKNNKRVVLSNVGFYSSLASNLISAGTLREKGYNIDFNHPGANVTFQGQHVLDFTSTPNKLFIHSINVNNNSVVNSESIAADSSSTTSSVAVSSDDINDVCYGISEIDALSKQHLLHCRMGHSSLPVLDKLIKHDMVEDIDNIPIDIESKQVCEACITGKAHRKPFGKNKFNSVEAVMDRLHVDLCGPIFGVNCKEKSIEAIETGDNYLMIVIDEYSRMKWCETFKFKSQTTALLIKLINRLVIESGKSLKELHTDGGTEFQSTVFIDYCSAKGIKITTTTPYTPADNPLAERGNRTLFERIRPAMHQAGTSGMFWPQAAKAMCYVSNRLFTNSIKSNLTPQQVWSGKKPSIKHIHVFGCDANVLVRKELRGKLDMKTTKAIYFYYDESQHGYLLFDIELNKFVVSRDVTFNEYSFAHNKEYNITINDPKDSYSNIGEYDELFSNEIELAKMYSLEPATPIVAATQPISPIDEAEQSSSTTNINSTLKSALKQVDSDDFTAKSKVEKVNWKQDGKIAEINPANVIADSTKRTRGTAKYYGKINYNKEIGIDQAHAVFEVPVTYEKAMRDKHHGEWKVAMDKEMQSLRDNDVYDLVPLPSSTTNIMGCRWLYKIKYNSEGELERFKARLVGQGFTQVYGVDFNETFAPVVKYKSLRVLLSVASILNYDIKQLDIVTAFLYATVKEDIYMRQPKGYETGGANMVWKLKKALYGTKQAPHEWNNELNGFIVGDLAFNRCKSDTCMYTRVSSTGHIMIMSIFVDDIICAFHPADHDEWLQIKQQISSKYKISDLGDLQFILGMKIIRDRKAKTIIITHERYINDMLSKFSMSDCATSDTPELTTKFNIKVNSGELVDTTLYQSLVGALLYTAISVRADISHAVNMLSRHLQTPITENLDAAKRVLRYLKHTAAIGLRYGGSNDIVTTAFCDADWAGDITDRKSQTGYVVKVGGNTVIWSSSKQKTTSLSTAEAEYIAISAAVQEVTWVNSLLNELSFPQTCPSQVYCDNQAAIYICNNDTLHARTKHIDIRHHYIREEIINKNINISYVSTTEQQADIFTKPLGKQLFIPLRNSIM
jgi:transposase InsO family protein